MGWRFIRLRLRSRAYFTSFDRKNPRIIKNGSFRRRGIKNHERTIKKIRIIKKRRISRNAKIRSQRKKIIRRKSTQKSLIQSQIGTKYFISQKNDQ